MTIDMSTVKIGDKLHLTIGAVVEVLSLTSTTNGSNTVYILSYMCPTENNIKHLKYRKDGQLLDPFNTRALDVIKVEREYLTSGDLEPGVVYTSEYLEDTFMFMGWYTVRKPLGPDEFRGVYIQGSEYGKYSVEWFLALFIDDHDSKIRLATEEEIKNSNLHNVDVYKFVE